MGWLIYVVGFAVYFACPWLITIMSMVDVILIQVLILLCMTFYYYSDLAKTFHRWTEKGKK